MKELMTRVVDAVAAASQASRLERIELERAFTEDPYAFVAEHGEALPDDLRALFSIDPEDA